MLLCSPPGSLPPADVLYEGSFYWKRLSLSPATTTLFYALQSEDVQSMLMDDPSLLEDVRHAAIHRGRNVLKTSRVPSTR